MEKQHIDQEIRGKMREAMIQHLVDSFLIFSQDKAIAKWRKEHQEVLALLWEEDPEWMIQEALKMHNKR